MIKYLFTFVSAFVFVMFTSNIYAQEINLDVMKQQAEVFQLNADLMKKKIDLEKERQTNAKIGGNVAGWNRKSDQSTDDYAASNPQSTAKDAKNTARVLKKTESANRTLERSNNKIINLEGDVRKLVMKLEGMKYTAEIRNK